jgi:hypothetical protein
LRQHGRRLHPGAAGIRHGLVIFACVAGAALYAWNAASAAGRRRRPAWRRGVLLVSATLLLVISIADPIGHLNNRFSGWLASAVVFPVR